MTKQQELKIWMNHFQSGWKRAAEDRSFVLGTANSSFRAGFNACRSAFRTAEKAEVTKWTESVARSMAVEYEEDKV